MSKVLIDRAVLEATLEHAEFVSGAACEADGAIRAVLVAPSCTPELPVKAYYHEAPNEHGGLNKSVGLEVRKTFIDTPLVLESDALAQIACLEGEIAKRDEELAACRVAVENCDLFRARIVELESRYQRDVYGLNNEGDPIGGDPAGGYANDNARLRTELAALKAQEPVVDEQAAFEDWIARVCPSGDCSSVTEQWLASSYYADLYAAPVSEAKAQSPADQLKSANVGDVVSAGGLNFHIRAIDTAHGVVMPDRLSSVIKFLLGEGEINGYGFGETPPHYPAFWWRRHLRDAVTRLNASPVQQSEYGDAYQGAREDLSIWKRRALESEKKVMQQEQIIDHLTSEDQGESRFGEPVITSDAPCVPDGYVLADKKALGTVLQALVNAPHHIRELQVTRQPVEIFSDNPINVLIANYEAPAAPVRQVSVPDGFERYRLANKFCEQRLVTDDHVRAIVVDAFASGYGFGIAVAPAAPAADAGLVEALEKIVEASWSSSETATDFAISQTKGFLISQMKTIAREALSAHRAKGVV